MRSLIRSPEEVARSQTRHQEEVIHKSHMHIGKVINDHLGKYPDEDGLHQIRIEMSKECPDFHWFWSEGLEEMVKKDIEASGWSVIRLEMVAGGGFGAGPTPGAIEAHLKLANEDQLSSLDLIRDEEKDTYHKEMR